MVIGKSLRQLWSYKKELISPASVILICKVEVQILFWTEEVYVFIAQDSFFSAAKILLFIGG